MPLVSVSGFPPRRSCNFCPVCPWVAKDELDYVRIAKELAADLTALAINRATLRQTMHKSPLMDVHGFTEKLEQAFYQLHDKIKIQEMQKS